MVQLITLLRAISFVFVNLLVVLVKLMAIPEIFLVFIDNYVSDQIDISQLLRLLNQKYA